MARFETVDVALEAVDVPLLDALLRRARRRRARELRLGDEQLVGEAADDRSDLGELARELGEDQAERGAELVEPAVGADAQRILRYARPAGKSGRSTVARPSVEPRDTLASGRPGSSSRGELSPWTGQNEMWSTSLCLASFRHSRQMNPLRSLHAIPNASMLLIASTTGG